MRIASGTTDQYIYFVAQDSDGALLTGLSSFTVYRSRNGGAAAAFTTPTINETDSSNMPGVYELLLDEDTTIDAGDDTQEMVLRITHAGMTPVTRSIELHRPKATLGATLDVTATGAAGIDLGNVENQGATLTLSGTTIKTATDVETDTADIQSRLPAALVSGRIDASVGAIAANAITATAINTGALTAAKFAAGAFDAVWTVTVRQLAGAQTWNLTGDITGNLSGTVGSVAGAVGSVTGNVGGNVVGSVGSISGVTFPTNFADLAIMASTGRVDVALVEGADATDVLLAAAGSALAAYDPPTNTELSNAVAPLATAAALATVDGVVNAILIDTDTTIPGLISGLSIPSVSSIVNGVWNEPTSGHSTAGTTGRALADASAAGDPWSIELPGLYTSGTAGHILGTNLDAAISGVGGAVGSGAIAYTETVTRSDTMAPLAGVDCWVSTDSAGSNVVAGVLVTNAAGQVTFQLDAGTYYLWRQLAGYNFTNPITITVS